MSKLLLKWRSVSQHKLQTLWQMLWRCLSLVCSAVALFSVTRVSYLLGGKSAARDTWARCVLSEQQSSPWAYPFTHMHLQDFFFLFICTFLCSHLSTPYASVTSVSYFCSNLRPWSNCQSNSVFGNIQCLDTQIWSDHLNITALAVCLEGLVWEINLICLLSQQSLWARL